MAADLRQNLEIKQEQRQHLSANMIQVLQLLMLPSLEFSAYLEQQLLENPLLELQSAADEPMGEDTLGEADADEPRPLSEAEMIGGGVEEDWRATLAAFGERAPGLPGLGAAAVEAGYREAGVEEAACSQDLLLQVAALRLPPALEQAVRLILDSLEESGYLRTPLPQLAARLQLPLPLLEQALAVVQGLEPAGLGARDLGECLALQIPAVWPARELALAICRDHLADLARGDSKAVVRALAVDQAQVEQVFAYLRSLEPRPAAGLVGPVEPVSYLLPDLLVEPQAAGGYCVRLLEGLAPRLGLQAQYRQIQAAAVDDPAAARYLRQKLEAAQFLLRNIERRRATLLRLAEITVAHQQQFFRQGPQGLQPLTMRQVAEEAELHPSTVSRAVSGKYLQTPHGLYPWKFFFSHAYASPAGELSSQGIKQRIAALVAAEDPRRPLSDQKLQELIAAETKIAIARRTIAKYRDAMQIPSSSLRRQRG